MLVSIFLEWVLVYILRTLRCIRCMGVISYSIILFIRTYFEDWFDFPIVFVTDELGWILSKSELNAPLFPVRSLSECKTWFSDVWNYFVCCMRLLKFVKEDDLLLKGSPFSLIELLFCMLLSRREFITPSDSS